MKYKTNTYGHGDRHFAAMTFYSDPQTGDVVAVGIPTANSGRSGMDFYHPTTELMKAAQSMERTEKEAAHGNRGIAAGTHILTLARAVETGRHFHGNFYYEATTDAFSTKTNEGALNAGQAIRATLERHRVDPRSELGRDLAELTRPGPATQNLLNHWGPSPSI